MGLCHKLFFGLHQFKMSDQIIFDFRSASTLENEILKMLSPALQETTFLHP